MMTVREAMQRVAQNNARIQRSAGGDWRVTLNEWYMFAEAEAGRKACYTDDLEDAVLTASAMRRRAETSH